MFGRRTNISFYIVVEPVARDPKTNTVDYGLLVFEDTFSVGHSYLFFSINNLISHSYYVTCIGCNVHVTHKPKQ